MTVNALLDTGFTDWLAMDIQDILSLGWSYIKEREMHYPKAIALPNGCFPTEKILLWRGYPTKR